MTLVEGVGAASLEGWEEPAEVEKSEVGPGGDTQIFATLEAGEGASGCDKGGELKLLGSSRGGLRECGVGESGYCGEQG